MARVYSLLMEDGSYIHLCGRHLKEWRIRGGTEKAKVAKEPVDCDHCLADPRDSWRIPDDT